MEKQTAVRETLLKEFANCSDKLFTLGIIRTDSFTGEIGEFIASKYFKLSLAGKSTKAYDGVCPKGYKYQIKSKVISNNNLTHHISNLKYQDFDYLVVVYFDIYYNPISILKIPSNKINTEEYIIGASSVHSFSQNIARLKLLQKEQVAIRNFAQSYLNLQKEGIIRSRKVVGDIGEYYACKNVLLIFSSHFFERYIERFLELNKDEKQYTSLDIIKLFYLRNNHIGCIKPELEDLARGFCEDGMILGEWISESAALIKTFLSRNELKVNQYTEYYDMFHNWIIQDMFLAHKGYSLSSMEEFDNLPDSYFSPKEWEKFLKLRGNEMWINIAIECSEFRIEHKEEYEKCSNMLQAIMDNRSLE